MKKDFRKANAHIDRLVERERQAAFNRLKLEAEQFRRERDYWRHLAEAAQKERDGAKRAHKALLQVREELRERVAGLKADLAAGRDDQVKVRLRAARARLVEREKALRTRLDAEAHVLGGDGLRATD